MARQTRDSNLETRTARARLCCSPKPYWRSLEEGLHLGYRKPRTGSGCWLWRTRTDAGTYREAAIGRADDFDDADGEVVLCYAQAQSKARAARIAAARIVRGLPCDDRRGPFTVADAMDLYRDDFVWRGKKAITTIDSVTKAHILPPLGTLPVDRLSRDRLARWHSELANADKMLRTRAGKPRQRQSLAKDDPVAVRRRRSSANRILTVLKAALNFAFAEGRVADDSAWRRVKPFRSVDAARVRTLTAAEAGRFIAACGPEFQPLVRAALATGCRYGELTRLKVGDVDLRSRNVFIAESKSGRPRRVPLTDEGVEIFQEACGARAADESIFLRDSFSRPGTGKCNVKCLRPWRASEQRRLMLEASKAAGLEPITFHELRHTYASMLVSAGVAIAFVAEVLGHSDTRMVSVHYSHLAPSTVADAVRANLPRLAA
jgi:integrase